MQTKPSDPHSLSDFKLLSFDCYGTLVDWESGIYEDLKPLISKLPNDHHLKNDRNATIKAFSAEEEKLCLSRPGLNYRNLLAEAYTNLAATLSLPKPSEAEAEAFGASVGKWQAFPDSIDALKRLSKKYKLVILSNVDNKSFAETNAKALEAIKFDAIYTAEGIGSYKPDLKNLHYLLDHAREELGVKKEQVLHVGHGLKADHVSAKKMGLTSVWIERRGGPLEEVRDDVAFTWQFETMGDMADAVDGGHD